MAALATAVATAQEVETTADSAPNTFWKTFNARLRELRTSLKVLTPGNTNDLTKMQALKAQLSELQIFATEATPLLPAYDVRRSQEEIEAVGKEVRETEATLKPKKKFAFSSRNSTSSSSSSSSSSSGSSSSAKAGVLSTPVETPHSDSSNGGSNEVGVRGSYVVSGQTGTTLTLSAADLRAVSQDGVPVQLLMKDCSSVCLSAPALLGSVRLEDLYECTVFLGPCCTSVYLEDCRDCTVVLACHQLRIHKSHHCQLYVRVNSHPIIEDCTGMGFSQYCLVYDGIQNDIQVNISASRLPPSLLPQSFSLPLFSPPTPTPPLYPPPSIPHTLLSTHPPTHSTPLPHPLSPPLSPLRAPPSRTLNAGTMWWISAGTAPPNPPTGLLCPPTRRAPLSRRSSRMCGGVVRAKVGV